MRSDIEVALDAAHRVGRRADLRDAVGRYQLDEEVRRGHLIRVGPRAYSRPWDADLPETAELAALRSTGGHCALSHLTALCRWDLPAPVGGPIHITATTSRRPRPRDGVRVHRSRLPMTTTVINGAPTVSAALAIAESWPLLFGSDQRAPILQAVSRRLTTVAGIRDEIRRNIRLHDRAGLLAFLELIEAGCQSELELWGYAKVFDVPGLRGAVRQRTVVVHGRSYRLDMAYEPEQVAVELDGRTYHSSPAQWERDIARDLAVATLGWQTIRLSHRRGTTDIDGCRRDVLKVLRAR